MKYLVELLELLVFSLVGSPGSTQNPPTSGLYFIFRGSVILPDGSVYIEDIGPAVASRVSPESALMCNTINVNTNCCRRSDNNNNGRIGDWFYPNNSRVISNSEAESRNADNLFVRIGFEREVRLVTRGTATGPLGRYSCRVPNEEGETVSVSINVISNPPRSGLYFIFRGSVILPNGSVHIEDIGPIGPDRSIPESALICNTINVNTDCCRGFDNNNGSIGDWFYPNNSRVIKRIEAISSKADNLFVRVGYSREVRLVTRGVITGPLGRYSCRVPDRGGQTISASINIISGSTSTVYDITNISPTTHAMFSTHSGSVSFTSQNKDTVNSTIFSNMISSARNTMFTFTMKDSTTFESSGVSRVIIGAIIMAIAAIIIIVALILFTTVILIHRKALMKNASKSSISAKNVGNIDTQLHSTTSSRNDEMDMTNCAAYGEISAGQKLPGDGSLAVYETI